MCGTAAKQLKQLKAMQLPNNIVVSYAEQLYPLLLYYWERMMNGCGIMDVACWLLKYNVKKKERKKN